MAKQQLHVAVIGAGLGGLAAAIGISRAGHLVTILEQAAVLGEGCSSSKSEGQDEGSWQDNQVFDNVEDSLPNGIRLKGLELEFKLESGLGIGAGIQIPPNSSRILQQWGLLLELESVSVKPINYIVRSYRDGKILNKTNLFPNCEETYGVPFLEVHRADFHRILVQEAQRLGVDFRLGSRVESINFNKTSIQIKDGGEFHADVILGADGLKSKCREALLGRPDPPRLTGYLAYRIIVKTEDMMQHPDLVELALEPNMNTWAGPESHAVCYLLKKGGPCNIVLLTADNLPEMVNTAKGDVQEMLEIFKDWDPKLRALLSIVQETLKWRVFNSEEMKMWSHSSGTFTLLGDACHATLPNLAQGAAMALEDGAVLGLLFEKLQTCDQVKDILSIYEHIRKPRTTRIVKESTAYCNITHLRDGPKQQERDRQLLEEPPFAGFPNRFSDPEFQRWMYDYDANAEVEHAWEIYLQRHSLDTEGGFRAGVQGELSTMPYGPFAMGRNLSSAKVRVN